MSKARVIKLKTYQDRESVLRAEKHAIRSRRPEYNVQHNRYTPIAEPALAGAPSVLTSWLMLGCITTLAGVWLMDGASARWIRSRAREQGAAVVLPPRRNPFAEPSFVLTLLEGLMASTQKPGTIVEAAQSIDPAPAVSATLRWKSAPDSTSPQCNVRHHIECEGTF
jgi:hypothetical protein